MDSDWSPVDLDRKLARGFAQWRSWRARVHDRADPDDEPLALYRDVAGLSLFRDLAELHESDPLRTPLRRWVYRLAEQRINHTVLTNLASTWQRELFLSDAPARTPLSLGVLLDRSLGDPPRREIWVRLLLEQAPPVSALSVELWQRRREIAARMGLDETHGLESPASNMQDIARRLADTTRDRVHELGIQSTSELIGIALGREIPADWPARLTPQRLLGYFRDGDFFRSLDLHPTALPQSLGAASLGRALSSLGSAWLEALAPRDQPFVVAHDPYGLRRHEAAALFSQLLLSPRFLSRHLEVSSRVMADVQRQLGQIWLLELARAAFRVQLRPLALAGERPFREAYRELAHRDLGLSLPPNVAGALFRLRTEDEQRLTGQLLAARRERELVEAHDEDWFRNPRAIEQLRAEANRPPDISIEPETLDAALTCTVRRLGPLLR